jgi:GT2 family glycosyltransferase
MCSITSPGFSKPRSLSICIVTWNSREFLCGCLSSLEDFGVSAWAEILVVDNASTDGTVDMVRARFQWAKLIQSEQNLGYSRGNNVALRQAHGEFLLLLNPDTIVRNGSIERLLDAIDADPKIGVVGPLQVDRDGQVQYEAAVNLPTIWNVLCDFTRFSKLFPTSSIFCGRKLGHWDHLDDREVPAVAGSAMLVRREVLRKVGLFDETMFYAEDMDLCRRTRDAGWKVFYAASAPIVHFGGGSTKNSLETGRQLQIALQSMWLYLRKNRGPMGSWHLSVSICLWSAAVMTVLWPAALLTKVLGKADSAINSFLPIAKSLFLWSLVDKRTFRHHLAIPLDEMTSQPGLPE